MWNLDEQSFIKIHLIDSVATLLFATAMALICLFPALLPEIYEIIIDERISIFIPYLLFIGLGESLFSIWYFKGHKKLDRRE